MHKKSIIWVMLFIIVLVSSGFALLNAMGAFSEKEPTAYELMGKLEKLDSYHLKKTSKVDMAMMSANVESEIAKRKDDFRIITETTSLFGETKTDILVIGNNVSTCVTMFNQTQCSSEIVDEKEAAELKNTSTITFKDQLKSVIQSKDIDLTDIMIFEKKGDDYVINRKCKLFNVTFNPVFIEEWKKAMNQYPFDMAINGTVCLDSEYGFASTELYDIKLKLDGKRLSEQNITEEQRQSLKSTFSNFNLNTNSDVTYFSTTVPDSMFVQ